MVSNVRFEYFARELNVFCDPPCNHRNDIGRGKLNPSCLAHPTKDGRVDRIANIQML